MGCMKLTYQINLKPVYRVREKEVARKEKESRQNLWETVDTGNYYYGARYMDPKTSIWLSVDPLSDLSPNMTPYHFVANNPVRNIDPDGRDWYEVTNEETGKTEIKWTDYSSQDQMNENSLAGTYLGKAVVVMDGRGGENLDENGKLTGDGANPAKTTIYGPGGQDDVRTYDGLTISSNPEYFTPIEQGDYEGFYQQMASSPFGKGSLTYRIKQLNGDFRIPTADGELNKDPASENYGTPWKTDIFFHRTNNSGFAGARSRQVAVSKGCPVICATQWRNVESQLGKIISFRLRIIR